jgi:hypothetical protein
MRQGATGAYLRGLRAALCNRDSMQHKHRHLMTKRRIADRDFLARLRDSERQIYDWLQSRPLEDRSALLKLYFGVFGKP